MTGIYFKHKTALALYRPIQEHQQYWEEYWQKTSLSAIFAESRKGLLGEYEDAFNRYLPQNGIILEAGCGIGKHVVALRARGYYVEGIDYATQTVERVLKFDPTLPVQVGNILQIERPDNYYAGYISLGVLEHFFEGPEMALREAYRVIQPQGIAIISVPLLNWPRRHLWKTQPDVSTLALPSDLSFYQFHLDPGDFCVQLNEAGFQVLSLYPHALYSGLIRDWRLWGWLDQRHFFSWRLKKIIRNLCVRAPKQLQSQLAHMIMFVAQKM